MRRDLFECPVCEAKDEGMFGTQGWPSGLTCPCGAWVPFLEGLGRGQDDLDETMNAWVQQVTHYNQLTQQHRLSYL